MKSTYQKNLQPYPSPHQNALHELPWHGPEPQRSPGLCSHLLGEALSPSTGICPSLELLVSDYFGGSSRVLCLTDCPSTPAFAQLIHELLEGELAAYPPLLLQALAHSCAQKCWIFLFIYYRLFTSLYQLSICWMIWIAGANFSYLTIQ